MKTLPVDIEKFGFVEREKHGLDTLANRCGRDFLYYALHYTYPEKFNSGNLNPAQIEAQKLFGFRLPSFMMWTQLQFYKLPQYLKDNNLKLFINEREINSFVNFVRAILFSRMSYEGAIQRIERSVDEGRAVGIDIGLKYGGLLDHVMFVYGCDEENLYVCDTHQIKILEYEKIREDNKYFMRLPKRVAKAKWTRFGRVWEVKPLTLL